MTLVIDLPRCPTQDGHDQAGHTEPVSLRLLMMRRGLALLSYVWRLFTWRAG